MNDHEEFDDIPGTTVFTTQAFASGLPAQPVLHESDEAGEPRAVLGRRTEPTSTSGR
jgi:hypothetical protein